MLLLGVVVHKAGTGLTKILPIVNALFVAVVDIGSACGVYTFDTGMFNIWALNIIGDAYDVELAVANTKAEPPGIVDTVKVYNDGIVAT